MTANKPNLPPAAMHGNLCFSGPTRCDHCDELCHESDAGIGPHDETLCGPSGGDCLRDAWDVFWGDGLDLGIEAEAS